jgi:nucleotide-binding universal stress UspA family protein
MSHNKILIPVDFTPVAKSAISYAVQVAKEMNAIVHLLHIVKNQEEVDPCR